MGLFGGRNGCEIGTATILLIMATNDYNLKHRFSLCRISSRVGSGEKVSSELKRAIMHGRTDKKLTQAQLARDQMRRYQVN
nr:multiprotein-bridging factor 1b-like [Tanacetum cinerariifolium]